MMDSLIIFAAKDLIILPPLVVAYLLFKQPRLKWAEMAFFIVIVGILSFIFAKIGSHFYYHPRPFIGDHITPLFTASRDNGFPSDHTLLASFLAFSALRYSKKIGMALLVLAVLIGWARVAAGVHHTTDVIGAFVFTGLAYLLVTILFNQRKHPTKPAKVA